MTPVAVSIRPFDPVTCPLAELTQHIREAHHAYLRLELPAIWESLREAIAASPAADVELRSIARLFGQFRSTLENHLRKEEAVLFPFIERLEQTLGEGEPAPRHVFGPLALPIEILEAEHALGDRLLDRMRPMWNGWRAAADDDGWRTSIAARLGALDADMQRHVHVEDAILFPRTIHLEGRPWPSAAGSR